MKKFVIAIPSKGRLYGETFSLVKKIKEKIDIYVYVNEVELEAYSEEYPDFIFVPHNKKSIGEIRLFIQEHQYQLGNDMMMMDDDIRGFKDIDSCQISINRIIREAKEHIKQYPLVYYFYDGAQMDAKVIDEMEFGMFCPGAVVVESTELYEKGIRYRGDVFAEDTNLYMQLITKTPEVKSLLLPFFVDPNTENAISHFTTEFRNCAIIEAYLMYGDVIELRQDYDMLVASILADKIERYRLNGASYSKENDVILKNIEANGFPGYALLEKWDSNFNLDEL
jgi:hypothetical protein